MDKFIEFKKAVHDQMDKMMFYDCLYRTETDKDAIWDLYLRSFPEGSNPIFRERTEHDCQCCRQFIRACGNMVVIKENRLISIWDIDTGVDFYNVVSNALSEYVKSKPIQNIFLHEERTVGTDFNHQSLEDGKILKFNHFHYILPSKFVKREPGSILSRVKSNKEVMKRSLVEITIDSAETVLDLIDQNSLYRGTEHRETVNAFLTLKNEFESLPEEKRDNFCWDKSSIPAIRNMAIGTLLVDISNGVDLDQAVRMFETKVAPVNYKRTTAVISKGMIENAQKTIKELDIEDSLSRRYAKIEDITINNILFADRSAKQIMNVFDELKNEVPIKPKSSSKIEEVDIETFISVIPRIEKIELLFENKHINNLVSLISPVYPDAKPIFKWNNNFSWSYNGEVTDSIKERVRKAGGNVTGILRWSLSWFNSDDLDIHVVEPDGNHIFYGCKGQVHRSSGVLDVDMNVRGESRTPVENIVWTDKSRMQEGTYTVLVHQFTQRETKDVGFDIEMEYEGETLHFHYPNVVKGKVEVAQFKFTKKDGVKFISSLESTKATKEIWGISTQLFHKVSVFMNSPNHWDGKTIGNKHYFFMLENCKNDQTTRGFYNEFLHEDLRKHRKVFEVLSSKLKVEKSDQQLSGLGFSSTKSDEIVCKVEGSFNRTLKIKF